PSSYSTDSCFVHQKELRLPATVRPTIAPSSTVYLCDPLRWTHPFRVFPSNRSIHPLSVGSLVCSSSDGSAKAIIESPYFVAFLPPPPAAITRYCFPSITYTLGVA